MLCGWGSILLGIKNSTKQQDLETETLAWRRNCECQNTRYSDVGIKQNMRAICSKHNELQGMAARHCGSYLGDYGT